MPSPEQDGSSLSLVPWRVLEAEIEAWDRLAGRVSEPNPFFESWYLLPSLRHLPDTDRVAVLRFEQAGELAGLMPILRQPRYYRWPAPNLANWLHENAFCGMPLVARGAEDSFWRALLHWADRNGEASLFLHLRGMVENSPLTHSLTQVCREQARQMASVHREHRAFLSSDLAPEAYFEASLSGRKRKELRRQAKRLDELGDVRFERSRDDAQLDQWCAQFLSLESAGWKGKAASSLGSSKGTEALFIEALSGAAARGRLERIALMLDGRPIAMLATFLTPPGAFSFKTAFDETYSRFSPGVLLQRDNLAILDDPVIAWTDSCAASDHPMIDHIWRERRTMARLSIAIGGPLRRAAFRAFVTVETARHPVEPTR